jgi:glycosyltransferase involved in cell wall biosynthesis
LESAASGGNEVDCSVVIATYNRAHLLVETLRSLDAQHVPPTLQWEIIVVDNNSSDRTKETVRRFGETSSVAIRYEFEPRLGQSFARNTGIEAAKGALILFTDDDILPDRTWVSGMLSALTIDRLHGVGGRVLPQWEAALPGWLSARPDLLSWLALVEEDTPCLLEYPLSPTRRIVGASMAFRREVFEEFGLFKTSLGHRGRRFYGQEEVEFIHRLLLKGLRVGYDPSVVVHHRLGASRLRKSFFVRRYFDHACGQARHMPSGSEAEVLGVRPWRFRHLLRSAGEALVHTALRRSDAFTLQLALALEAGTIWGTMTRRPPGSAGPATERNP